MTTNKTKKSQLSQISMEGLSDLDLKSLEAIKGDMDVYQDRELPTLPEGRS